MKLFVTGICGRLGRGIAAEALDRGHEIVGLDIADWPEEKFGPQPANVTLHIGNFADPDLLRSLIAGCDGVIHTAGPHGANLKDIDMQGFLQAHVVTASKLLDVARECGVKGVVLSSTMEVIIGRGWSAYGAAYVDEETPIRTDSVYSMSRAVMETMAREYARQYNFSIACMRFMAFGYQPDNDLGLGLLARSVASRDCGSACILAALRDDLRGEVFHIGPDSPLTPENIGEALNGDPLGVLESIFPGCTPYLDSQFKRRVNGSWFWPITSTRRAQLILGWRPRFTFERWLRDHGWTPAASSPAGIHRAGAGS